MTAKDSLIVHNIGQLVSLAPLAKEQRLTRIQESDLGILTNAWMHIDNGKVQAIGEGPPPKSHSKIFDAHGALVMPGLIDSHTHPVFAGSRANEFVQRLDGKSYADIANSGGGIQATVQATRSASDSQLEHQVQDLFHRWLSLGVTTLEAKSGYGLSVDEELRHLRILKVASDKTPQHIEATCLALHAIPKDMPKPEYIADVTHKLLPVVAEEKLANWVDAFIEEGYFSVDDCELFFSKAKKLGLGVRIHADEFSNAHAAQGAAKWHAASADHLQFGDTDGIKKMAAGKVVATLLPGTSLYTNIPFTKASPYREAGCAIAVASDYNPGSCKLDNLAFIATMAAVHCGLSYAEAIAAVTIVAGASLNLSGKKGALAVGYDADFMCLKADSAAQWLAEAGRITPTEVWIKGERAYPSFDIY